MQTVFKCYHKSSWDKTWCIIECALSLSLAGRAREMVPFWKSQEQRQMPLEPGWTERKLQMAMVACNTAHNSSYAEVHGLLTSDIQILVRKYHSYNIWCIHCMQNQRKPQVLYHLTVCLYSNLKPLWSHITLFTLSRCLLAPRGHTYSTPLLAWVLFSNHTFQVSVDEDEDDSLFLCLMTLLQVHWVFSCCWSWVVFLS